MVDIQLKFLNCDWIMISPYEVKSECWWS